MEDGILEKVRKDWNFPKVADGKILPLLNEHNPMLLKKSQPWMFPSIEETNQLVLDLGATMRYNKAIGIAAIQCGLPYRVFLMEIGDDLPLAVFNPTIVDIGPMIELDEGCLSFPQLVVSVKRPSTVRARFRNLNYEVITYNFEGLSARVFLHEYDHLDGIVMRNRVSRLKYDRALAVRKKRIK